MLLDLFGAFEANLLFSRRSADRSLAESTDQALDLAAESLGVFFENFNAIHRVVALLHRDRELFEFVLSRKVAPSIICSSSARRDSLSKCSSVFLSSSSVIRTFSSSLRVNARASPLSVHPWSLLRELAIAISRLSSMFSS